MLLKYTRKQVTQECKDFGSAMAHSYMILHHPYTYCSRQPIKSHFNYSQNINSISKISWFISTMRNMVMSTVPIRCPK